MNVERAERHVLEDTNAFRREQGREAVAPNRELGKAARYFAEYMASTDRYGHNADGQKPEQRARVHGFDYCLVSENIAMQYNSAGFDTLGLARGFVEGWKKSPNHRKNMLESGATQTAVAIARSPRTSRWYAVQMFGRPRADSVEFRITNSATETVSYDIAGRNFSLRPGTVRIHEECSPEDLTLKTRGGPQSLQPRRGDRLVVVRESGRTALRLER